jgi:cell division septation protein DedD
MAVGTQMSEKDSDQFQDTEITLGTGKLLGIFFALAIVCGLFFAMGYMLGKNTSAGGHTEIIGSVPSSGNTAGKPAAGNKAAQTPAQTCPPDSPNCTPSAITGTTDSNTTTSENPGSTAPAGKPADQSNSQPLAAGVAGSFLVQVAAVSKQEDAELLKSSLQKKNYPVFIANSAGDPLFHVQVGPFTDKKDAEAMRTKLAGDGYMAIVK